MYSALWCIFCVAGAIAGIVHAQSVYGLQDGILAAGVREGGYCFVWNRFFIKFRCYFYAAAHLLLSWTLIIFGAPFRFQVLWSLTFLRIIIFLKED